MFQAARHVDLDGDGVGECGTLAELTGREPPRGSATGRPLDPPLASPSLHPTGLGGQAYRAGYLFRLYLPGQDGTWVRVDEDPGRRDVDAAEQRWCVFAWPVRRDEHTRRTFRIDASGRVTATNERVDPSRLGRIDTADWTEVR